MGDLIRVPPNWWALQRIPPRPELPVTYGQVYDPVSIGVAVLVNTGFAGTITGALATAIGIAVIGAAAVGVGLLAATLFSQQEPTAEDRQQVLRQSFGPRLRSYGRVKVGGNLSFFEAKDGILYIEQTINHGEISAIEEIWFNDQQVTVNGFGQVEESPWQREDTSRVAVVNFKLGTDDQTVHDQLDTAFTEVTSDHRLRGYANLLARFWEVASEEISEVYGNGNPTVRVVVDASLVEDVRTEVVAWSDNPANVIYDALVGTDGAGFPFLAGFTADDVNRDSFEAFADLCDETVPLAAGGTIKRFRLWGSYLLNEEVATVLRRMLKSCDADLYIDTDGKIAIRGGQFVAPTLTLEEQHIIAAEFRQGRDDLAAFNELTISYVEPTLDYSTTEAEYWVDNDNIALRGQVLPSSIEFEMCPHHAQARRLAKIHTHKSNPQWAGQVVTNFYGFNAIGEDTVHIVFPPLGIDHDFLIERIEFLDDLTGCRISVSSITAAAYEWDAETEQGADPPDPPDTTSDDDLAPPDDFEADDEQRELSGTFGAIIVATWTNDPDRPLSYRAQYRVASPAGPWVDMTVVDTGTSTGQAESGIVDDGETYDVRVRSVSPGGVPGSWSTPESVTVTADPVAPGALSSVSVTGGLGHAALAYTTPASANISRVAVYRAPTGVALNRATHLVTEYPAVLSTAYNKIDGDNTRTDIVTNGAFTTDTSWSKSTAETTIAGGKLVHVPGAAAAVASQAKSLTVPATYRYSFTISGWVASTAAARMSGTTTVLGTLVSGNGQKLGSITTVTGNNTISIFFSAAAEMQVDDFIEYLTSGSEAPQGVWDYYLEAENGSGVPGTLSGPHTVTVI